MTTDPTGPEPTAADPTPPDPAEPDPTRLGPTRPDPVRPDRRDPDAAERERREPGPAEPGDLLTDLPPIPAFDDRAIGWAITRGIARAGLFATIFLTVVLMVLFLLSGVLRTVQGERFSEIVFDSVGAAHPEYQIAQEGSCCTVGGLGGIPNLGLASELRIRVRPTGALNYGGDRVVAVDQDVTGEVTADFGNATVPLDQVGYGRPDKARTLAFIHQMPAPTRVSVVVEFSAPLDEFGLRKFFDDDVPIEDVHDRSAMMYLTDPYDVEQRHRLCWPNMDFGSLERWANELGSSDNATLKALGLPPAVEIKRDADQPLAYAIIMPSMPLSLAAALVANPAVRSLLILDVAIDPGVQNSH